MFQTLLNTIKGVAVHKLTKFDGIIKIHDFAFKGSTYVEGSRFSHSQIVESPNASMGKSKCPPLKTRLLSIATASIGHNVCCQFYEMRELGSRVTETETQVNKHGGAEVCANIALADI